MTDQQALVTAYRWTGFAVISIELENVCEHVARGFLEPEDVKWARPWAVGNGRTRLEAIGDLVRANLQKNARTVFERQEWRCLHCGKHSGLQADHIVPRGRGAADRDDRITNLQGLCVYCHIEKHGPKRDEERRATHRKALEKIGDILAGNWTEMGQTESQAKREGSGHPEGCQELP